MRINHTKRIFMTEEDGSPGGGAAPLAPAEPPASTAAPAPAPAITIDQVKGLMTEMLGGFENKLFANARKAGLLKKDETTTPVTPPASAPASSGLSADEVRAIVARETALVRISTETKLTDAQAKWMRDAVEAAKPDDVLGYCKSFVTDLGLARTTETAPTTPAPAPQPSGQPISDKGSPAPGGVVAYERELAENPVGMSSAARSAMDAKYGVEKARKMRVDAAQAQLLRIKATTK